MLYDNIKLMMHMQGHIDSEKQQNLDLSDLTQCKHCFRQFDTPFEMQKHIEKVHQSSSNVLVCRICEKDHDTHQSLASHMRISHKACEMPYYCSLCKFRSSVYNDVIDHFKKCHNNSQFVLCFYCLGVIKVSISKQHGWGMTQNFYQHLQKHQVKGSSKRCTACKLVFFNKTELKNHKQNDHVSNQKATNTLVGKPTSSEQVMIKVNDGSSKLKSLNAPSAVKVQEYKNLRYSQNLKPYRCVECKNCMDSDDHFKKFAQCTLCRYATNCSNAYSTHMLNYHTDFSCKEIPEEQRMKNRMYCMCGFSSRYGNIIANHLVFCSKQACYKDKQTTLCCNEEESSASSISSFSDEPPRPATIFDALGLVKKKPSERRILASRESPHQIARSILHDVINDMFPAETAAEGIINNVLDKVFVTVATKQPPQEQEDDSEDKRNSEFAVPKDPMQQTWLPSGEIPPELTGSRKWSTVRINEVRAPSKRSVFLGTSADEKVEDDIDHFVPARKKRKTPGKGSARLRGDSGNKETTESDPDQSLADSHDAEVKDEEYSTSVAADNDAEKDEAVAKADRHSDEEEMSKEEAIVKEGISAATAEGGVLKKDENDRVEGRSRADGGDEDVEMITGVIKSEVDEDVETIKEVIKSEGSEEGKICAEEMDSGIQDNAIVKDDEDAADECVEPMEMVENKLELMENENRDDDTYMHDEKQDKVDNLSDGKERASPLCKVEYPEDPSSVDSLPQESPDQTLKSSDQDPSSFSVDHDGTTDVYRRQDVSHVKAAVDDLDMEGQKVDDVTIDAGMDKVEVEHDTAENIINKSPDSYFPTDSDDQSEKTVSKVPDEVDIQAMPDRNDDRLASSGGQEAGDQKGEREADTMVEEDPKSADMEPFVGDREQPSETLETLASGGERSAILSSSGTSDASDSVEQSIHPVDSELTDPNQSDEVKEEISSEFKTADAAPSSGEDSNAQNRTDASNERRDETKWDKQELAPSSEKMSEDDKNTAHKAATPSAESSEEMGRVRDDQVPPSDGEGDRRKRDNSKTPPRSGKRSEYSDRDRQRDGKSSDSRRSDEQSRRDYERRGNREHEGSTYKSSRDRYRDKDYDSRHYSHDYRDRSGDRHYDRRDDRYRDDNRYGNQGRYGNQESWDRRGDGRHGDDRYSGQRDRDRDYHRKDGYRRNKGGGSGHRRDYY